MFTPMSCGRPVSETFAGYSFLTQWQNHIISQRQTQNSARSAAEVKHGSWWQAFDRCSTFLLRCHVAAFSQRPSRALRSSRNGKTICFRNVKQRTRLVQPQKSNMALGGRSLIGVVNVYSDVMWPPCLRDLCGLFVPHAMATPYDFATSNTDLGSSSR